MPSEAFLSFLLYLAILIYISNIIGNLLVILVLQVKKRKSLRSPNMCLILALAHADLWFSALVFANFIILCNQLSFPLFNIFMNALASVYIYVSLAVERYIAILKPFVHMRKATKSLVNKVVITIFIFAVVLSIPGYFIGPYTRNFDQRWSNTTSNTTPVVPDEFETRRTIYSVVLFLFGLIFPSIAIIFCYARVVHHVWFTVDANRATNAGIVKSRRKLTRLFILTTLIFIMTWSPTFARLLTTPFGSRAHLKFGLTSMLLCLVGSTANPLIYIFRCPGYRRDVVALLTGQSSCCKQAIATIRPFVSGTGLERANAFPLAKLERTEANTPEQVTVISIRKHPITEL